MRKVILILVIIIIPALTAAVHLQKMRFKSSLNFSILSIIDGHRINFLYFRWIEGIQFNMQYSVSYQSGKIFEVKCAVFFEI